MIGRRPPVDADLDAVYEACARPHSDRDRRVPGPADLSAEHVRWPPARARYSASTATPRGRPLDVMRYGIGTAQRGWLGPDEVINTWPLTG